MKKITTIITTLLVLLLICCKENPVDTPEIENDGLSYKNEVLGFKMSIPEGWEFRENIQIGEYEAILVGSKRDFTGTQPEFNIIQQRMLVEMDAVELLSSSEQNLPMMFPDIEFDSKNIVNVGGYECAEIVFHHYYQGVALKQKQLLFMCQPTTLLVITFNSALNEYVRNHEDFEKIQNSIKKL